MPKATKVRSCFVIMPIRKEGSDDYIHFRALYDEVIKATVENLGFTVVRSDEIQKTGAITKEIIRALAEADLVIADLTDMNPNVFYELGVRHTLLGNGTVMILDEERTPSIPFDIGAYRVIKFTTSLAGTGRLRRGLAAFVKELSVSDSSQRDNPVHDSLPSLPISALDASRESDSAVLREEIASLKDALKRYEDKYGTASSASSMDPLEMVSAAIEEAKLGHSSNAIIAKAEAAVEKQDHLALLEAVKIALEKRTLRLSSAALLKLSELAAQMDLDDIVGVILERTRELYPTDSNVRRIQLGYYSHSENASFRQRAREEIAAELGVSIEAKPFKLPTRLGTSELGLLTMMLDAYYRDGMNSEAAVISSAMAESFPNKTVALRNHARSLCRIGQDVEGLEFHRLSVTVPDVDDTSARWLGNELHNRERHVDACEAYLLAAVLDPGDADHFAHAADEVAYALHKYGEVGKSASRALPDGTGPDAVRALVACAFGCGGLRQETFMRCAEVCRRSEVDLESIMTGTDRVLVSEFQSISNRKSYASKLYTLFQSPITSAS